MTEKKIGYVNGIELKKGDIVEIQIKRLAGKDYEPPIIHRGTVVNPVYSPLYSKGHYLDWVVQIKPEKSNDRLPDFEFSGGIMAFYGADIIGFARDKKIALEKVVEDAEKQAVACVEGGKKGIGIER